MCERSQFELQLFADNKQRPVEVYWYMPSLQDFQCMLKSQEDIQHKQENIGVHFKAIWNMLTAVASITGVPLDTSNKPEVVIPTHKQSEDEALTPQPHRLGAQPQLPVRIGSPRVPCACTRWPSASP